MLVDSRILMLCLSTCRINCVFREINELHSDVPVLAEDLDTTKTEAL
jgi:hypothetical protein